MAAIDAIAATTAAVMRKCLSMGGDDWNRQPNLTATGALSAGRRSEGCNGAPLAQFGCKGSVFFDCFQIIWLFFLNSAKHDRRPGHEGCSRRRFCYPM